MADTEGSVNVAADEIWDGNYIRARANDPWMRVVDSDDSVGPEITYYGPNDQEITVEWQDNQIAVRTELAPADEIRPDDDVQHPQTGEWVKLHKIAEGTLGTRSAAGERKSRQITFYYEEDSSGLPGEFDSYVEILGEEPVSGTPKKALIWRRVRD
ncbi:hypothetical protein AFM11_21025 [Mycolicibacterium wolinskyi]|uniref:Uncharacterized protein n=1 Tax=Mycolicibacterium wolinskyi TaxID=59750 RepID=A0A132PJE9_9MYCO|nr:hypothetical protein [Mycolicibacterium wolinskyi]KWX22317.1 hypothetical protein AFM11_21025 [Mycolicibacterium wolinskyi]